jgi:pimeloyl-ACP methyl ester carboxylesterase
VSKEIELSAGTVAYEDSGEGPVIVLLHGLMMDSSLFADVIADLSADYRCLAPTLPLGAHRVAVRPAFELTLAAIAGLVTEFLERLDLRDVTLVGSDTGGALAQFVVGSAAAERVGRLVLVSCEAFGNYPAGLAGKTITLAGKLPPRVFGLFMQQLRVRPLRRQPTAFGWLTKRGDAATARWMRPVMESQPIRRDAVRLLRGTAADRRALESAGSHLAGFDRPALVVWATEDRAMPLDHGRRLVKLLPHAQFTEVADSYTLISLDQPAQLAALIRTFARPAE